MKKIILMCCICLGLVNSVFAYSPTSKDNSLLESIEHRINDMSVNNLVNIVNRLEIVLDKLSRFSRTYYMLSEIEKYIGDRIVADALKQQESYPGFLGIDYGDAFFLNNRVQFGITLEDSEGVGKNRVLQIRIPSGLCFERLNKNIPLGFTYFTENNGTTWKKWSSSLITNSTNYSDRACNVDAIKLVYPKDNDFLAWGSGLGLSNQDGSDLTGNICVNMLATADNSQYEEDTYCFRK